MELTPQALCQHQIPEMVCFFGLINTLQVKIMPKEFKPAENNTACKTLTVAIPMPHCAVRLGGEILSRLQGASDPFAERLYFEGLFTDLVTEFADRIEVGKASQ